MRSWVTTHPETTRATYKNRQILAECDGHLRGSVRCRKRYFVVPSLVGPCCKGCKGLWKLLDRLGVERLASYKYERTEATGRARLRRSARMEYELRCTSCTTLFWVEVSSLGRVRACYECRLDKIVTCQDCDSTFNREFASQARCRDCQSLRTNLISLLHAIRRLDSSCTLTIEFLTVLWTKQSGLCAQTLLPMKYGAEKGAWNLFGVSIDRISNDHGHTPRNVQLVTLGYQLLKNRHDDQTALAFLDTYASQ